MNGAADAAIGRRISGPSRIGLPIAATTKTRTALHARHSASNLPRLFLAPRRVQDRQAERERLEAQLSEEEREIQEARARLADGEPRRLSDFGRLDRHGFQLFLPLLGEALPAQANPQQALARQ